MNPKSRQLALIIYTMASVGLAAPVAAADEMSVSSRWPAIISTGLRSSDLERSLRFYTEVLGMSVLRTVTKGDKTEVMLGFPGNKAQARVSLMHTQGDNSPVDHGNTDAKIVLGMPDVEAVAERVTAAGFSGVDLRQHSRAKILIVHDPDGYKYEIIDIDEVSEKN